jgi:hypothetical protein
MKTCPLRGFIFPLRGDRVEGNTCFQNSVEDSLIAGQFSTNSRQCYGAGGVCIVCIVLELDRAIKIIFGKLFGEIGSEFLRHLKYIGLDLGARKNQKKNSPMPRSRTRSSSRYTDPSFLQQLWMQPRGRDCSVQCTMYIQ